MRHTLAFAVLLCALLASSCRTFPVPTPTPKGSPRSSPASKPLGIETPGFLPIAREEAPLGLTSADGTGQKLISLKAQAVLEGPLAFTQLHLVFENPENRVVEGRFEITMPDGAAISRFAMKVDEQWQEAEVVERKDAQRVYEDFLHRKQDPALLEKEAGNEFHARIFPIPAGGSKEILISYSQELQSSSTPYMLPLAGLPKMEELRIEVSSEGKTLTSVTEKDYQPHGDYAVPQNGEVAGLAGGELVVARVRPAVSSMAGPPEDLLVLFDTSASRALGFTDQAEQLSDLVKELSSVKKLTVAAFDQSVEKLYEGEPAGFSPDILIGHKALGATDLQAALAWAAKSRGYSRLLLVSDGITTAGQEKLGEALQGSELQRIDVLLVGGIRDKERMASVVSDSLPQEGTLLDGDLSPRELARKLSLGVNSGIDVAVEGAKWVWPTSLDGVQPGDERLVYAAVAKPGKELSVSLAGAKAVRIPLQAAQAGPLLTRASAVARIARLESLLAEAVEPKSKAKLAEEIVEISSQHRVLSDLTAMLVLESEYDYQRFGIDRKALSNILEVGPKGLALTARTALPKKIQRPEPPTADDGPVRPAPRTQREVQTRQPKSLASSTPSADYLHEVESADYQIAQSSVRTYDNRDSLVGTVGGASSEGGGPAYTSVRGLIERDAAEEIDSGAEFSAYIRVDNEGLAQMSRREAPADNSGVLYEPGSGGKSSGIAPLEGKMAEIDTLLKAGKSEQALKLAWAWRTEEPGNVLPLLALGDCLQANKEPAMAARVYGSIIDLFPARADLRRFAGARLQGLQQGLPLAVDSFRKAVKQRPDHVSSHRFLAFGLARQERFPEAFQALEEGLSQNYPGNRFAGWQRVLGEDLRVIGAAWAARAPEAKAAIEKRLSKVGVSPADKPSLRFVLTWETDANDVDFHIEDAKGGHAYYGSRQLGSGGELFADVTTGYGPECFAIEGAPSAFPYKLRIHYYARGPMGYGMGQLEIMQHDGKGRLRFEERSYVVMNDGAFVELGAVEGPLK